MLKKTVVRMTVANLRSLGRMVSSTGDWKLWWSAVLLCWPAAHLGENDTIEVSVETYQWFLAMIPM